MFFILHLGELSFAGQLVIPLSKANIQALKESETAEVEVEAYLSGSAVRTLTATGSADTATATVQKMILAEPDDDMPAKLSVECNIDVQKVGQDANGTISLCVMDNGEVMSSLLMMPVINDASFETVMENDCSQPPAMSIATETVQELQFVEPVRQTVTAVEQCCSPGPAAVATEVTAAKVVAAEVAAAKVISTCAAAPEAADLIPFRDILVSKPNTDFAVCEPRVQQCEEPLQVAEDFSAEKLILSLAADADHCLDSSVASLVVSPQLEVFEPTFPTSANDNGCDASGHPVASCSLTVACNTRKQLRKVLEHRRPASISH